jgi:hypothetical protein
MKGNGNKTIFSRFSLVKYYTAICGLFLSSGTSNYRKGRGVGERRA